MNRPVNEPFRKVSAVKSIDRAANVLCALSFGLNSVTDIANFCKLSKSTVHRLLKALTESNLVVQDPISREYYLGYLITRLISRPQVTHDYLITRANNEMNELARATDETIELGIMIGLRFASLQNIPSKNGLRVVEEEESRRMGLIHPGAAGNMLLSQLDDNELKTALTTLQLEPVTQFTITDQEELEKRIKQIRRQGYAVSSNERIIGAMCIAAPLKNYVLPAVLCILGPTERMQPHTKEFIELVLASSAKISKLLV